MKTIFVSFLSMLLCRCAADEYSPMRRTSLWSSFDKPHQRHDHPLRREENFRITTFLSEDDLLSCRDNLLAADLDKDDRLTPDEYASFLSVQSSDSISVPFRDLQAPFILIYYTEACDTCFEVSNDDECCVGENANIGLGDRVSPVEGDTVAPTNGASSAPTTGQLATPSVSPVASTGPPSVPTAGPAPGSIAPTPSGRIAPTMSPVVVATVTPTENPAIATTPRPSLVVVQTPTQAPVEAPTGDVCITFAYGLTNAANLTAEDILNENGNMIRTGLEAATRSTTINILNETFPRDGTTSRGFRRPRPREKRNGGTRRALAAGLQDVYSAVRVSELLDSHFGDSGASLLGRHHRRTLESRRLVFYSDDTPAQVFNAVDNPFCGPNDSCAIVDTRVCVFLEEGDDPAAVQLALLGGFREAIDSGAFQAAIPPEFLPTS
ncbi:predicted protein [Phaeodactylum tricornutum CCAP 1055/1]|uniref:Calmodulin n=1 Tax=Phaeodactylum tricornutum (strain CCAP 1055/1) TaxID=556484 RepID=B7G3J0_PHATC|nr:predicted protein [Phaeodactylum tricornutum CCAP 1055/1]EEC47012.1 predicted protein [Phaeodactylum tricornutum CCAP 1055/1]|eukprot:XP_002181798.1 predicted protein [Phaeodactylum tricornutum CCAP 1055/1]